MPKGLTPTAQFYTDPEGFCKANMLYPGGLGEDGGICWVRIVPFDRFQFGSTIVRAKKRLFSIPCFTLEKVDTDDDAFQAYWCPYKQNGMGEVAVGRSAKFLFTVQLNGCSLGFGSADQSGSRLVRHVNLSNAGPKSNTPAAQIGAKQIDQIQQQRIKLAEGAQGTKLVEPAAYRQKQSGGVLGGEANVFGVFQNGGWTVKALTYSTRKDPGRWTFTHTGVKDLLVGV